MVDNHESDSDDYDVNFISNAASRLQGILRKVSSSPSLRVSTVRTPKRLPDEDHPRAGGSCSPKRRKVEKSLVKSGTLTPPPAFEPSHKVTKRNTKTARAIAALAAVKVRRQTTKNDDIDDSLEIVEKTFEIPQNFLVKIRWKHQVKRLEMNPTERLGLMLMKFSDEVGVDAAMLKFLLDGKALDPTKSLEDYGITIASIIDAHIVRDGQSIPLH